MPSQSTSINPDVDFLQFQPLILRIARYTVRNRNNLIEEDDLVNAGLLAAWKACKTYDPNHPKGASLKTWVIHHIHGAMKTLVRNRTPVSKWIISQLNKTGKKIPTFLPVHTRSEWERLANDQGVGLTIDPESKEFLYDTITFLTKGLPLKKRMFLHMRFTERMEHEKIGEVLGLTKCRIIVIQRECREHMRKRARLLEEFKYHWLLEDSEDD